MPDSRSTTVTTSFYELLTLPPEYHPSQETPIPPPIPAALLRKTYRRTSLLYHPDKNPSPDAAALFHTLTTAYDVLSDAAAKLAYDQALVAGLARKRKSEAMGSERRRMKEELEARERAARNAGGEGLPGPWKKQKTAAAAGGEEAEFERQLGRLREEGARLRMKREEALRKAELEAAAEEEENQSRAAEAGKPQQDAQERVRLAESRFSELDRTVFIKLRADQGSPAVTAPALAKSLSRFGEISSCLVREPPAADTDKGLKKRKKKKEGLTTGVIVFKSILSAYDAVHAFQNGQEGEGDLALWGRVKEVKFAGGKDPDVSGLLPAARSQPRTAAAAGLSFRPAATRAQKAGLALSSAEYESATLLRMREAERTMLEARISAQEAGNAEIMRER
ncbi:hypothetical protein EV426DRAFT_610641 [Tirmania nivea]|nr:hypothetical protein EV426DRAFT_610641 [Tirmania nivea]